MEALKDRRMVAISGDWRHTAAADDAGNLYTWGWNKASCSLPLMAPAALALIGIVGYCVPHTPSLILLGECCPVSCCKSKDL